ncbi:hypothetical protein FNU76_23430 [Chitinimonas arctica]|uniref:Uncharacterized protein n=1 Tax=Chitinimonas arctica TaxID=2594795 RepID=A0A516SLN4_9NEIS|nr:hypothetical protein [Chitinimonas arctica]QDQ29062.1 hypothetical protein FNU76_23430 [Chitinimonas arctica]
MKNLKTELPLSAVALCFGTCLFLSGGSAHATSDTELPPAGNNSLRNTCLYISRDGDQRTMRYSLDDQKQSDQLWTWDNAKLPDPRTRVRTIKNMPASADNISHRRYFRSYENYPYINLSDEILKGEEKVEESTYTSTYIERYPFTIGETLETSTMVDRKRGPGSNPEISSTKLIAKETYLGNETLVLPGNFTTPACKFESNQEIQSRSGATLVVSKSNSWYAPEIGLVKSTFDVRTFDGQTRQGKLEYLRGGR